MYLGGVESFLLFGGFCGVLLALVGKPVGCHA